MGQQYSNLFYRPKMQGCGLDLSVSEQDLIVRSRDRGEEISGVHKGRGISCLTKRLTGFWRVTALHRFC